MVNTVLLQSGILKDYQPLGSDGNPVYQAAPQLRAAIKRTLGEDIADLFAIPQRSEDGNRIDWYAPHEGAVVPWSSATPEEQRQAKQQLLDARARIEDTGRMMQADEESERQVFGRLLDHVTKFPNDQHVQLVNGRPVITFWGFNERGASLDYDALSLLPVMEPDTGDAVAVEPVVPVETVQRRRFSWWWLLLPLLLLLLGFLLFWLLRGCSPTGLNMPSLPGIGLPDAELAEERPLPERGRAVDADHLPGTVDGIDRDIGAPAMMPDGLTPGSTPDHVVPPPEVPLEQQPEETTSQEDAPGDDPAPVPPQDEQPVEEESPPPEPDVPLTVPPVPQMPDTDAEPLVIPPDAIANGNTEFLNGRWRGDSGLMDRNGRPVDVEYEFKDGEGVARYRRSNGVVCEGPTSAAMKGSSLVITDGANIVCQDGVQFKKSSVECQMGGNGLADCTGSYASGESFSVEMDKANNN